MHSRRRVIDAAANERAVVPNAVGDRGDVGARAQVNALVEGDYLFVFNIHEGDLSELKKAGRSIGSADPGRSCEGAYEGEMFAADTKGAEGFG